MNKTRWITMLLFCAVAGSCNENQPPADSHMAEAFHASAPNSKPSPRNNSAPTVQTEADSSAPSNPVPPSDAQWSIYCDQFRGPGHVELSTRAKAELKNHPRLHDWYVVHHAEESTLFYGYYADVRTRKAQSDKRAIDEIANMAGERRFHAQFVPLVAPDPDSPPEWNLANTPPNRFWSLQIAAYRGSPERKKQAVEAVREARAQGIEAYYYHGDSISSVCIGAWPKNAVRQQSESAVAKTSNPDTRFLVTNEQLPSYISPEQHDAEGHPVQVFAPKLQVDDATMKKAIKDYPYHAINGEWHYKKDSNGQPYYSPSFLVQIPDREKLLNTDDPNSIVRDIAPVEPRQPADTGDASLGQLHTIGEH